MSVPTKIQASSMALQISLDGVTYKSVVCKRSANFTGTTATNEEETDCGRFVGLGATSWSADFEGVVNTTPNGATEMSANTLISLWQNKTLCYIKFLTGSGGSNVYVQGQGYITEMGLQWQTPNLVAFTFNFLGDGDADITE